MKITDVRIKKLERSDSFKAVASVTFDDEFVVHEIKVIQGERGLFISMPSKKLPDGSFKNTAHPINAGAREKIQAAVLDAYNEAE